MPRETTLRVLLVSATYAAAENCKKLVSLGRHCHLEVATVSRVTSIQSGIGLESMSQVPNVVEFYRLESIGDPASTTRYALKGLSNLFKKGRYDLVFVEAEPWALIRWQSWILKLRFQRSAVFGEFTWENLERPWLKQNLLDGFYRLAGLTSDFMICGSRGAEVLVNEKAPRTPTFVAPQLGVDGALFAPVSAVRRRQLREPSGISADEKIVGFCGRISSAKGVDDLARAVKSLRNNANFGNVRVAFLGKGSLRPIIEDILGESAIFVPPLPHHRVNEFMQMLDVLVLPSKKVRTWRQTWQEQFGHVLIEAMACGIPVIGSRSGAIPEVIGSAGLLFDEGNVEQLADQLAKLLGNPDLSESLSAAGRIRVEQEFTNERIGARWAEIFLLACGKSGVVHS